MRPQCIIEACLFVGTGLALTYDQGTVDIVVSCWECLGVGTVSLIMEKSSHNCRNSSRLEGFHEG